MGITKGNGYLVYISDNSTGTSNKIFVKPITAFLFSIICCMEGQAQASSQVSLVDTSLAKKITVSGFCLTQKRKWIKRSLWTLMTIFILMNIVALFHSYKFTHFADSKIEKTRDPQKLTTGQKIKTLIFGISNPRPENNTVPTKPYETITLKSNKEIECWSIK